MLQDLLLILKIIKRTYIAHKKRKVSFDKVVRRIEEFLSLAYLFDDKEADAFFHRHYSLLVNESDMGCVLIGASAIDQELIALFETITPNDASSKIKKRIFDGRGVLGELSSKLDIAYLSHLIPKDLYLAVHELRKLRNLIAHEVMAFKLENHIDEIYTIFFTNERQPRRFNDEY